MKHLKLSALFMALVLVCSFCFSSCSVLKLANKLDLSVFESPEKKAFKISGNAYANINYAYDIVDKFGSDLYEAWRLGIYEDDEIMDNGVDFLAKELSLSKDEIKDGIAYTLIEYLDEDWEETDEAEKDKYRDNADLYFAIFEDSLFNYTTQIVMNAYLVNGKIDMAKDALDKAKTKMKELSTDYADYEHYPSLKGYLTTTNAYLDFCQNPNCSFEQLKDIVSDYEKEARDYKNDLDFIFEDVVLDEISVKEEF